MPKFIFSFCSCYFFYQLLVCFKYFSVWLIMAIFLAANYPILNLFYLSCVKIYINYSILYSFFWYIFVSSGSSSSINDNGSFYMFFYKVCYVMLYVLHDNWLNSFNTTLFYSFYFILYFCFILTFSWIVKMVLGFKTKLLPISLDWTSLFRQFSWKLYVEGF